jgi:transcriptional regulator with XRE-family HTH domain
MEVDVTPLAKASSFGAQLRKLREKEGITREELAKRAGVSGAAISRIEQGKREPGWETVIKLARALGVSVSAFDAGGEADASGISDPEPEPPNRPEKPKPRRKK